MVKGLGSGVYGIECRGLVFGCRVATAAFGGHEWSDCQLMNNVETLKGLGFMVHGSWFRVQGSGFRVHGSG